MYCLENTMKTILRQSAPLLGFLKESQEIDDRVRLVYFNREIYLRYGANLSLCCCYSHESGQIKFILLIYLFTTVCDYTYYTCTSKPPSHSTNTIHQQHNFYLSLGLETPSSNKSQRKNEERMMLWCLLFSWKGRKKMVLLFNSIAKSNNRTS